MLSTIFNARLFPLRYTLVGVLTYLFESTLYAVLLEVVDERWYLASYYAAGVAAFAFNFTGHTLFTFRGNKAANRWMQFLWEASFKLGILAARGLVLYGLVHYVHLPAIIGVVVTLVAAGITFCFTSFILGGFKPRDTFALLKSLIGEAVHLTMRSVRSLKPRSRT